MYMYVCTCTCTSLKLHLLPNVLLQSSLKELFSERQRGRETDREPLPTADIKQEGEKESGKMSQKQLEEV